MDNSHVTNILCTLGHHGVFLVSVEGEPSTLTQFELKKKHYQHFSAKKVEKVINASGAGDTFVGATVASLAHGRSLPESIRFGIHCAALTIQSMSTVSELLTPELLQSTSS